METTADIQEMESRLDNFLAKEMREESMTGEEIQDVREKECIAITVHGEKEENFSISKLEEQFKKDIGSASDRISVPRNAILEQLKKTSKTGLAINTALEKFEGITVTGIRNNHFLSEFLQKLDLQVTSRQNTAGNTSTIATWLEEEVLVVNMLEEVRTPQAPAPADDTRSGSARLLPPDGGQAAVIQGLQQLTNNLQTFKEVLPDLSIKCWENMR